MAAPDPSAFWQALASLAPLVGGGGISAIIVAFLGYRQSVQRGGKPAAVPIPWVALAEAVAWIREAGGVPVLAHPSRYGLSQTRLRLLLQEFREAGGLGMEVSSGSEKTNVVQQLAALSLRFELHASQGSDYHGAHMPWLKLGVFPDLPKGCRPIWELFQ